MSIKSSYNEYKFHVANAKLRYVRDILDALYGGTDPYPSGVVDSIYYDTMDRRSYRQCLNGDSAKIKYRIRGYGDGSFNQVHRKEKDLYGVGKIKCRIQPVTTRGDAAPGWEHLAPLRADDPNMARIQAHMYRFGPLVPAIRVRYLRFRYRINDYRITLDTNIEVMGFTNGWDRRLDHAVIPYHVLEVKTADPRPHLPLLGLARLPQISFSKFFLGLNLIATGDLAGTGT